MVEKMKDFLFRFFIQNWQRKTFSLFLAVFLWTFVSHSQITTKTFSNIIVRVSNIPESKTVEGLLPNGTLNRKVTLTLTGNRNLIQELTPEDLLIDIDGSIIEDKAVPTITTKNLHSLNPDIDLTKGITKVSHQNFSIHLNPLVTDTIPIFVTSPIGEAPRNYQFLDVWPYQLKMKLTGPEEIIKSLKAKGIKLTFNLNNITKSVLDEISSNQAVGNSDEVGFLVPDEWKKIKIPLLSEEPITINDPMASMLRIDFLRSSFLPLNHPVPVVLFFPLEYSNILNPENVALVPSSILRYSHGIPMIQKPLFVKGVSSGFLEVVRKMVQVSVVVLPNQEKPSLEWSVQFISTHELENRYIAMLMADEPEDNSNEIQAKLREDYLRNRFRNYMNRFRFYDEKDKKLDLKIEIKDKKVQIAEWE